MSKVILEYLPLGKYTEGRGKQPETDLICICKWMRDLRVGQ